MEDYNKIIESLNVKFVKISSRKTTNSIKIKNLYDAQNTIILSLNGNMKFGEAEEKVDEGNILFIPGRQSMSLSLGKEPHESITNEELVTNQKKYLDSYSLGDPIENDNSAGYLLITFDAKAFDSVNFFTSLGVPPFVIDSPEIANIMKRIYNEMVFSKAGSARFSNVLTDEITIRIFRYILDNGLFIEQIVTNSNYFKDPRLIKIFNYIKDNLAEDLSNKTLATIAKVSEDYVGQYFKMLTGINPQDYIEYQRMEKAVDLLRTSNKSIRVIGGEVGYKDTAYFCRRFKMMFGIPAGKMRRRETLFEAYPEV